MEKDFESWFHHQQLHLLPPNPNLLGCPFDIGELNNQPVYRNPYFVDDSMLRSVPLCPVPYQQQQWKANESNFSSNWFNGTPHSYKAFTPALIKEKFLTGPATGISPDQKRFLVFDQSGDKTTLIYSSEVKAAVQRGTHLIPIPPSFNLNKEPPDNEYHFTPITKDECGENKLSENLKDEMREDTEELNALLYSDNNSYFSKDYEETSTGHSPSTTTENGARDSNEETGDEVGSSFGPCKRHKLLHGGFDAASNVNKTTVVKKTSAFSDLEDDAESSSGNCNEQSVDTIGSLSGGKRPRREKIRETLSVLQNMIPSVKGKDSIVVIDEAINYLKSLKAKAMALGFDTL